MWWYDCLCEGVSLLCSESVVMSMWCCYVAMLSLCRYVVVVLLCCFVVLSYVSDGFVRMLSFCGLLCIGVLFTW